MERNTPVAATRVQRASDRTRSGYLPVERDRKVLVLRPLPGEAASKAAVVADFAVDHGRALEGVEAKALGPDRHQPLRRGATRRFDRRDGTDPAPLQPLPGDDPARLQRLPKVRVA